MLLSQACKVYFYASLSLEDIFDQVPQTNQLCLITAMMLQANKICSDPDMIAEPRDPLTLFQRWVIRCRVAGVEESGLEFGESKYHVEALESKLTAFLKVPTNQQNQILQCQISSELGQYYCWNGQYEQAIKYHSQCQDFHRQHTGAGSIENHVKCGLDMGRTVALLKLSRLAIGESLEDPKENLLHRLRALEQDHKYNALSQEFLNDNISRNLSFIWRQNVLHSVLDQADYANGAFIAVSNALYHLKSPCEMMLEIPSSIIQYLRAITFENGHEPEAYLSPSIFEDLMQFISQGIESLESSLELSSRKKEESKEKIRKFTKKLCDSVRHVLCYDAAWRSGVLEPTSDEWGLVWDMYSTILARDIPKGVELMDEALQNAQTMEAESKALILERMDPDDIEQHIRNSAAGFITQEDQSLPAFAQIDFQLAKHSAWAQIGILAVEHDQRREQRIQARLEQRLMGKEKSLNTSAKQTSSSNTPMDSQDGNAMDVDDNTAEMEAHQERVKKEEHIKEDEARTSEICRLLSLYLTNYGALELNLQLRCLGICISGKQWDFLSQYGRTSVDTLDKNIHCEICQVYSVLVPLVAVLSMGQSLGVDFRDISTSNCLESLFSKDLEPIQITRVAALDMIQGLLPLLNRPVHNTKGGNQPNPNNRRGRKSVHEDLEEDVGHAAILKLLGYIRLRGVIDVFGALLAGAISSVLPDGAKLTLSEFGYYALFTTSMDSLNSWSDPNIKIIAILSNDEAGKALDAVPGARQRFAKLLIQVYERQLQFEADTLTKRMNAEASFMAAQRYNLESGLSVIKASTPVLPSPSSKASTNITKYSLCLTDLYHLEGMHQDALASFLNACLVSSRCFSDLEFLDRRIWSAFSHGPSTSAQIAQSSPSGAQGRNSVQPSQPSMIANTFTDHQGHQFLPLSAMPGINGQSPFPQAQGQVGLGLSPVPPLEVNGITIPGPMFSPPPGSVGPPPPPPPPPPVPPMPNASPIPVGGPPPPPQQTPPQPALPSTCALRAIESCIQLNELLAGVALQQFLPRIDYNQAFVTIRSAHEQGMLSFSGKSTAASTGPPTNTPITVAAAAAAAAAAANPNIHSALGPTLPNGPGFTGFQNGVGNNGGLASADHILSGSPRGTSALATVLSPRVHSSTSVFTPDLAGGVDKGSGTGAGTGTGAGAGGVGGAPVVNTNLTAALSTRYGASSLSPQVFLDLTFDLSFLELVSHLYKENKDSQGQINVFAKINSNRMALDARQPFRDQVHQLAQQDLLTRLWSKYARVG
ncbi:hypothetical protein BGZ76_010709 [Entomortierella beljakovae]|nr:hypothetical protein BGZ76_010709 [Entomortierella beljakovae]